MFSLRRSISAILLVTLIPLFTGCTSTKTESISTAQAQIEEDVHIIGVTTTDGEQIRFKGPKPFVRNDTLFASIDTGERIIGVTTKTGEQVRFAEPAVIRNDTVFGRVEAEDYQIALDDVEQVWRVSAQAYSIALEDVSAVWIERKKTNVGGTILLVAGVILVAGLVIGLIAAASEPDPPPRTTTESCPFVYSWDGEKYVFDAEPYGGATTRGLERDDFAELENLRAIDGEYRLRIVNELDETQHTNLMELMEVDHPVGSEVAVDEFGLVYTIRNPVTPISATDMDGKDLMPWLIATDRAIWEPLPAEPGLNPRQEVTLTFPKPKGATRAKLVANVATGLWGSHMIREMLELRGREVGDFYAAVDTSLLQKAAVLGWNAEQELFTLKVMVEEPTGWTQRGSMLGGGPYVAETRVVPLDVSQVEGELLRIRLRPPRGFWALNSFAVEYGADEPVRVNRVAANEAIDDAGEDVLSALQTTDDLYYMMPETGDWAELAFSASPRAEGVSRTVFLHSRGYYRLHLSEEGDPDIVEYRRLTEEPDGAARFAARRFAETMDVAADD